MAPELCNLVVVRQAYADEEGRCGEITATLGPPAPARSVSLTPESVSLTPLHTRAASAHVTSPK